LFINLSILIFQIPVTFKLNLFSFQFIFLVEKSRKKPSAQKTVGKLKAAPI
jgi:hypothetical protein